jgi:prepilin-type N-terminal cleavage/methylation domain-containing protein
MQELHPRSVGGFTLIELAIVLAVVAILTAFVVPSFDAYARRSDARKHVQKIASALQDARSQAVRDGNNVIVLFDADGVPGQLTLIDDDDNDWTADGGEITRSVPWDSDVHPMVTSYGASSTPPSAAAVPEDGGGTIPGNTTFAIDLVTGLPAVGFNPQGIPVALDTPNDWSTGAGSYYITDGDQAVYAVTLLPLGGVRVRVYRPTLGDWL